MTTSNSRKNVVGCHTKGESPSNLAWNQNNPTARRLRSYLGPGALAG